MHYYVKFIWGGSYLVDFNLEIEKLCPINIKEIESNSQIIEENIKKSIVLYNTAIGDMKKGDFNLGISDLKKAISYNKDFTEAIKVMGLCYANMNEYKKAEKIFKSLNKYEIYNELIIEYLQSLSIKKSMDEDLMDIGPNENISSSRKREFGVVKNSNKKLIISLLIVVCVIAGVGTNYAYPEIVQGALAKVRTGVEGAEEKLQTKSKTVDSNEVTVKNSEEEKSVAEKNTVANVETESIKKDSENVKVEADAYKNETVNMLNNAEKALNSENYEEAAGILINMKNRNFDDETKTKFDQLWQSLKPNPLWSIYNDGNKLYKQNKYKEALPKLLISLEFVPDSELMPWITYQVGICYKETDDKANALMYFNKVKENYPKSQYVSYADTKISEIGN